MALSMLGFLLLLVALLLCIAGLGCSYFNDNILHCVGLALILLWMVSEIRFAVITRYITARDVWLYSGIVCFGCGTAVRTWLYSRRRG